ncbi:MAG: DUF4126 domain-containing protein [Pseudomonadota bacterium]
MGIVETIALAMGLAWASGINLYATLAVLGILGASGNMVLPPQLEILQDPAVIAAAGFMYCVEFFADKTPGVDTTWDAIHGFIRIPAAAVLAAAAIGDISPAAEVTALILGGALGATSYSLKAGTRAVVNTSPEPFSNWALSLGEDVLVFGGLLAAIYTPVAFLVLLALFVLFAIWALPRIWRGLVAIARKIRGAVGGAEPTPAKAPARVPSGITVKSLPDRRT